MFSYPDAGLKPLHGTLIIKHNGLTMTHHDKPVMFNYRNLISVGSNNLDIVKEPA